MTNTTETSGRWQPETREDRIAEQRLRLREMADRYDLDTDQLDGLVEEMVDRRMAVDRTETVHLDGVPWHDKRVYIRGWRRLFHWVHRPQTEGWLGLTQVLRCRCGAIRRGGMRGWVRSR